MIIFSSIDIENINNTILKIDRIIIVLFEMKNKEKKFWFFEKTFLIANFKIVIVLAIPFLNLNNMKINFLK